MSFLCLLHFKKRESRITAFSLLVCGVRQWGYETSWSHEWENWLQRELSSSFIVSSDCTINLNCGYLFASGLNVFRLRVVCKGTLQFSEETANQQSSLKSYTIASPSLNQKLKGSVLSYAGGLPSRSVCAEASLGIELWHIRWWTYLAWGSLSSKDRGKLCTKITGRDWSWSSLLFG